MDQESAIRRHYDAVADEYGNVDQGIDRVLSRIKLLSVDASILDVGCGAGNLTLRLSETQPFGRVVGVDISEGVLDVARRHVSDSQLTHSDFICGSAEDLPFGVAEFDCVVSNMAFHLFPDQKQALAEVVRVLKPSGLAILQFLGGGPMMPEVLAILQDSWNEALSGEESENLLCKVLADNAVTANDIGNTLVDLGISNFEIAWRQTTIKIGDSNIAQFLSFLHLVGGFWRHAVPLETANAIDHLVDKRIRDKAASDDGFEHTASFLMVEFTKP